MTKHLIMVVHEGLHRRCPNQAGNYGGRDVIVPPAPAAASSRQNVSSIASYGLRSLVVGIRKKSNDHNSLFMNIGFLLHLYSSNTTDCSKGINNGLLVARRGD